MVALQGGLKHYDFHTHIGQYWNVFYDWHDVFRALKKNGVDGAICAYLTPKFDDERVAVEFFHAVTEEWRKALAFASSIFLDVKPLLWADPLVFKAGIKIEDAFSDFDFYGIALHPRLHDWVSDRKSDLTTIIFQFAHNNKVPVFIHTGVSEEDSPYLFEPWFKQFPDVEVHLAHCKDSAPIIDLFTKYKNLFGDTAFCPNDSYGEICDAGFKNRMFFGSDFPITHFVNLNEREREKKELQPSFKELKDNYEMSLAENAILLSG